MLKQACLGLVLLAAMPAWSQVAPAATGGAGIGSGDEMLMPPPVSNAVYPTVTGNERRSNYLRAGVTFDTAYDNNVLFDYTSNPVSSTIYSIRSTFAFDKVTPRLKQTLTYSPGYTFYQNASTLNETDQNAALNLTYRMSPHAALSLLDSFYKSSYSQDELGGPISGSSQIPPAGAIPPFGDQLGNTASGELSYQTGINAMIGASGDSTVLHYSIPAGASSSYDADSYGGSAFYTRRLTISQYTGVTYQYSKDLATLSGGQIDTQIQTLNFFYTFYWTHSLSFSLSGGPQYYNTTYPSLPPFSAWTPAVMTSLDWQENRVNVTASYNRTVSGAGGLLGAFHSYIASASVRWQMTRNWTLAPSADYYSYKTVNALFVSDGQGGHTIMGTVSAERALSRRFSVELRYDRLNVSYPSIAVLSANPNSNRESVSLTYHFERPLGR